jgi:hypothetical protein
MLNKYDQSLQGTAAPQRTRHRVALELEVDQHPDEVDPEDWDLDDLVVALKTGVASPLRTIRGLVLDVEHDRLSTTLGAVADDLYEAAQLHWLAAASGSPRVPRVARAPRPSLEALVDLEMLASSARRLARRLDEQGL